MKSYFRRMAIVLLLFGAAAFAVNSMGRRLTEKRFSERNVVAQRITHEIELYLGEHDTADAEELRSAVFLARKPEWDSLYGSENSPEEITVCLLGKAAEFRLGGGNTQLYSIHAHDVLVGAVEYRFGDSVYAELLTVVNVCLALCALFILGLMTYMYKCLIEPFNRLSDYPKRLSKGSMTEKLPVKRGSFFGRYVWGMNMLSDKLENDRQAIRRFTIEREQFVTALVHGIKTPAANIKLLCEAISTGLYAPDGSINEKDAELAGMIEKNADEIEAIVRKVMDESTAAVYDYNPDSKPFYRDELRQFLELEFANRLKVNRIPLHITDDGNPIIRSDFDGICRILRQLMDNAVKYGDGTGITVTMTMNDEGHFLTVANAGKPLPESEVHFVFNSLWRGSNAKGVEGHGVGLYEARLIARKLGGDIRMRTGQNETAVTLFLKA